MALVPVSPLPTLQRRVSEPGDLAEEMETEWTCPSSVHGSGETAPRTMGSSHQEERLPRVSPHGCQNKTPRALDAPQRPEAPRGDGGAQGCFLLACSSPLSSRGGPRECVS